MWVTGGRAAAEGGAGRQHRALTTLARCPLPGRLPSSLVLLLPPAPLTCCFTSAVEPPLLPGSAALKEGLLNSGKSPKWKAGWWFQYFSKRDFRVKDFCFAQEAVPLAFQIPLLIPQFLQQYQPQEENKVTGRTEIGFQGCICCTSHTASLPTSPQALEGRLSLSGTENFLSGRKVVHQVVWEL